MFFLKKNKRVPELSGTISVIDHPVIGAVTVSRTPRARRISVSVRPPRKIRLTFPASVTLNEAIRFLDSKQAWVLKALERIATKYPANIIAMPFHTRRHTLDILPTEADQIAVRVASGKITVRYPLTAHYTDEQVQAAIKKGIEQAWRIEAREILPQRVETLARELGFRPNSVSVRNTISKWGSCSARNDISLSIHLMRLPDHLVDYIIVHELCHTVHKNHGAQFHALLNEKSNGNHLKLRKEMKNYHTRW